MRKLYLGALAAAMAFVPAAYAETAATPWPADAKVFFVEPKDGAEITGPVKVVMGASGVEVVPLDTDKPKAGHHHILIDGAEIPKGNDALLPLAADETHKHFGKGQTETTLTLAPGKHTLQLLFGDRGHVPYDPALASDKITIIVK